MRENTLRAMAIPLSATLWDDKQIGYYKGVDDW